MVMTQVVSMTVVIRVVSMHRCRWRFPVTIVNNSKLFVWFVYLAKLINVVYTNSSLPTNCHRNIQLYIMTISTSILMFNTNLMLYKIQINNVFCLVKILVTLNAP